MSEPLIRLPFLALGDGRGEPDDDGVRTIGLVGELPKSARLGLRVSNDITPRGDSCDPSVVREFRDDERLSSFKPWKKNLSIALAQTWIAHFAKAL